MKGVSSVWVILGVLVAVLVGLYFFAGSNFEIPAFSVFGGEQSISDIYNAVAGPEGDEMYDDLEIACDNAGGTWYHTDTKSGCYGMDSFDPAMCVSPTGQWLEGICESISGAKWVCNANDIGCSY